MKLAANNITPVALELGGNDAAIVYEDIELDQAVFMWMYLGAFLSSGQICMAIKRPYVHWTRYDEVVDALTEICSGMTVGDGLLEETDIGPVNNGRQFKLVTGKIKQAKLTGTEIREGRQVPD